MGEFFDDCVESFDETKAEIDVKFSQLEGMVDWREKLGILEDLEGEIDGAEEEVCPTPLAPPPACSPVPFTHSSLPYSSVSSIYCSRPF